MLLNVPPNKDGLIDKREIKTLERFTKLITQPFLKLQLLKKKHISLRKSFATKREARVLILL